MRGAQDEKQNNTQCVPGDRHSVLCKFCQGWGLNSSLP